MIDAPDKDYVFYSTNNERVNEMLREAMQGRQLHSVGGLLNNVNVI